MSGEEIGSGGVVKKKVGKGDGKGHGEKNKTTVR